MRNRLFEAARSVMANAHAPYSKFPVGASILAANGEIYVGCNVENASYPEGCCAEASAISNMVSDGQKKIVEITVIAKEMHGVVPCGGCLQRISEFGDVDTLVHLCGDMSTIETIKLGDLLPKSFSSRKSV